MGLNIKEIAAQAEVSVATVSRTLNKPDKVLPETREKILAIIKEHGYVPNPLAKALSTGETNLVALIIPTLDNSFFAQLAEGCQMYLLERGYNLFIICSNKYKENELGILKSIDQRQFKGMLISGSGFNEDEYKVILDQVKISMVVIENLPKNDYVSSAFINDLMGIETAMDHFLDSGHKQIAVITGEPRLLPTRRRLKFILEYLREKLPDYEVPVVSAYYASMNSGRKALQELMSGEVKPTAVFAFNDMLALGVIKEAQALGVKIPEELSVIGFDDIPMASFLTPSLSTVYSPSEDLGRESARLLLDKIERHEEFVRNVLLPVKLVLRDSTNNKT
jgi:DNA-binding LacI/PurR family transcriptional regulator